MSQRISATLRVFALCASVLLKTGWCSAATFTWTGSVSSDWFTAGNWTPAGVPASSDTINLTNGTIDLTNSVTLNGVFNWSAGTLSGDSITIAAGGAMNIAGVVALQDPVTNAGTVTMTGPATLVVYNNNSAYHGGIYNLAGALWNIQTNANIDSAGYGGEFFNNAGIFLRSVGSGTATVGVNFTNLGMVTNLIGILNFDGGGFIAGSYDIAAGATIDFAGGSFTMGVPPIISGSGLFEYTGNTLTLVQDVAPGLVLAGGHLVLGPAFQDHGGITNLTLSGSALISTNTVRGTFTCKGGNLTGPITVAGGGVMNISGGLILQNLVTNAGSVTMTGTANLEVFNNGSAYRGGVYNLPGALWDIQTSASIGSAGYGGEFFNNAGSFVKSQGSGTAGVGVNFTNTGTVSNLAGILNFVGGGLLAGSYNAASNTTIGFTGGSFTMGVPPVISGSGLCDFTGTTLTLKEDVAPNLVLAAGNVVLGPAFQDLGGITNLTLSGSALTGTNTVTGTFTCEGGILAAPITIAGGGLMNINGVVNLQNLLTNAGTVTMTGTGNLEVYNNGSGYRGGVYNLPGALWEIETNANIGNAGYGDEFFNNAGTFLKSLGSGATVIGVSFTNTGTVTNLAGSLNFFGGGLVGGSYDTASKANIYFSGGSFTMGVPPVITGSGLCELNGGTLTLTENIPPNLVLAGGDVVLGPGFQDFGGITNLTLTGSILVSTNTVIGTITWAGGTIASPLTIARGGVMNIIQGVTLENVLTNAGTVTMTGNAYLAVYNNGSGFRGGVYNLVGALWNIETNADIATAGYGEEFFNNAGTFLKSGGSTAAYVGVNFTNTGTVSNLAGFLNFDGGGVLGGSYDTASGATTSFAGGSFTMGIPPAISGPGLCEITGGTLTVTENVPAELALTGGSLVLGPGFQDLGGITNLTLNGSTLISTSTVTGTMNWNGGTIASPITVANGGVMNIAGYDALENVLTNAGTVIMTGGGYLAVYNNGSGYRGGVYNLAGALWNIRSNANIVTAGYGGEFFNNAGVFFKSQGSGPTSVSVNFTNAGAVTNLTGFLYFDGGGILAGDYGTAPGATTLFTGGSFTMGVPPVVSGSGICELDGGTLTLTENVPANLLLAGGSVFLGPAFQDLGAITNLTLSGSTLISTSTVAGTFFLAGGTVAAPVTVAGGGVMNISGYVSLVNVLSNAGTVTMTGDAFLEIYNNNSSYHGGVYNLAGALWNIETNASIYSAGYGGEFFVNAGTFLKSLDSLTTIISVNFTNTGTVNAKTGTLGFDGSFTTLDGTLAFGVSSLGSFGKIVVSGALALNGTARVAWLGGFTPAISNSFALINDGSQSGTFANIVLPPGFSGQGSYGATSFTLSVVSASTPPPPSPQLSILPFDTLLILTWPADAAGYILESTTNLASQAAWSAVPPGPYLINGQYIVINNTAGAQQFFRLATH